MKVFYLDTNNKGVYLREDGDIDIYLLWRTCSLRAVVEEGYGDIGDPVFIVHTPTGTRIEGPRIKVGDYIWYEADGRNTKYGIAALPHDSRLRLLWKHGYRSSTRILGTMSQTRPWDWMRAKMFPEYIGDNYDTGGLDSAYDDTFTRPGYNRHGCFLGDAGGNGRHKLVMRGNVPKVLIHSGRYHASNKTYCGWYMAEDATVNEVEEALR